MGFQGLKKVPSGSPAGQVDFLACLMGKGPGKSSSYKIINLLTRAESGMGLQAQCESCSLPQGLPCEQSLLLLLLD